MTWREAVAKLAGTHPHLDLAAAAEENPDVARRDSIRRHFIAVAIGRVRDPRTAPASPPPEDLALRAYVARHGCGGCGG